MPLILLSKLVIFRNRKFLWNEGEPSADEPPQGVVRATVACGRGAAVEAPTKKEIKIMKNSPAAQLLVQVGRAGARASVRAAAEAATEDPSAGALAAMHAAAEAAEVRGTGVSARVLAAVEAAAEPPSAQEARARRLRRGRRATEGGPRASTAQDG
jgi:hypothetical protein